MADYSLKNLNFSFVARAAPRQGPSSSNNWNDSMNEIAADLAYLVQQWNNRLIPAFAAVPRGEEDSSINAMILGLDGKNLWVDSTVTATSTDTTYYDSANTRPVTIKEALDDINTRLTQAIEDLEDSISSSVGSSGTSGTLTDAQKAAIGWNIFDSSLSSSSSSLDGKSENSRLNIIQLAKDVYGSTFSLGNDGNAYLTYSVQQAVDALLEIHEGDWNSDISVTHSGVAIAGTQADINSSAPGDDTFTGSPINLEEDLDQLRAEIKELKGTIGWLTNLSSLYTGGANSIEDLLTGTSGSASKSATNPWGYHHDDVDGLQVALDAIKDFLGQDSHTTAYPTYSSTYWINADDAVEVAIGKLDDVLYVVSGMTGQFTNLTDTPSSYAAASGSLVYVSADETGLDFADAVVNQSGVIQSPHDIEVTDSGFGFIMVDSGNVRWRLHVDITGVPYAVDVDGTGQTDTVTIMSAEVMDDDITSDLLDISHIQTVGFQFTDSNTGTTHAGNVYFRLTNDPLASGIVMDVPIIPVTAGVAFAEYQEVHDIAAKYIDVWYHPTTGGSGETLTITAYRKYP